jgi:hypothetical protein
MQSTCAAWYYHRWPVRLYYIFPHYPHYFGGKKVIEHKVGVLIFSFLFSDTFFLFWEEFREISHIHIHISLHVKYTFLLVRFLWYLNSLDMFSNSVLISNFMKLHNVGAEMFHAEWRTDRHYVTNLSLFVVLRKPLKIGITYVHTPIFLLQYHLEKHTELT